MIHGYYFGGKTSGQKNAVLTYERGKVYLDGILDDGVSGKKLKISSRLGNSPRYISFPDGSQFETLENNSVDEMIRKLRISEKGVFLHRLETARGIIVSTLLIVILFAWVLIQYGIPFLSREIAFALPERVAEELGTGILETMDSNFFGESRISKTKKMRLLSLFSRLKSKMENPPPAANLIFRDGKSIGANAFALPNGTIVMTDDLVNLAQTEMELGSVMLHEMGHLKERHSLRLAVQNSGLAMFILVFTGDVSTSSSLVTAIPVILVKMGYSQDMELEADDYALSHMVKNKMNTKDFSSILRKIEDSHGFDTECESEKESKKTDVDCSKENKAMNEGDSKWKLLDLFSSHPSTENRIKRILNAGGGR